ncbi:type I restriction-modification system subunit M [Senegalia sp. (in: firmicutes)]|uniref:type I restriction-modification system subunit M n=1 Tax=Senegalia sp. (in: firmicutes) TaxID=1924098 RepID=UPI003F97FE73
MIILEEIKRRLWDGANELRGSMDVSRYKDYMLGLMFYKFLSDKTLDAFKISAGLGKITEEELVKEYKKLREENGEDLDKTIQRVLGYYVAPEYLYQTWIMDINSGDFEVQKVTDSLHNFERSVAIESGNDDFKGLFSSSTIDLTDTALGRNLNERSKNIQALIMIFADLNMATLQKGDILGDAYEYLIGQFAMESGKKAGEFYTPPQVSEVIARIVTQSSNIESIYDPTLGSGSLLLTVGKYLDPSIQKKIHYYGQEKNTGIFNLARMNLLINNIHPDKIKLRNGDTLGEDWPKNPEQSNKGLKFDAVVMNPPFSIRNWNRDNLTLSDPRFKSVGVLPPNSMGDFAFLLHGLFHLKENGTMAIVLPNGILFRGGIEGKIRKKLLDKNLIDTIIGLPSNLFPNTGIPVTILILKKNRHLEEPLLLIDATQNFVRKGSRNILLEKDVDKIVDRYINRKNDEAFSYLIPRGKFIGWDRIPSFEQIRAKKQIEGLETQYNKYKKTIFENIIKEFNIGSQNKYFEEIENTIYIPRIGTSNPVCSISELILKEQNYFQIVLKDTISNEYLAAMFKSDLGRLILETSKTAGLMKRIDKTSLCKSIIPVPDIDIQKQIGRTLDKLETLKEGINKFDKELALNPTTSIKIVDQLDQILAVLEELTDADYIRNMIRKGESKILEFKETFSYDVRKKSKEKYIEKSALKTIVGFLNSDGGILLIGVNDEGIIKGINTESEKFYKNNNDRYLLNFKNALKEKIGEIFYPFIRYRMVDIDKKLVLMVECEKSDQPCYLEDEEFYVRTNPATDKLSGRKMFEYIRSHFELDRV